jgi:hypothetical protein
VLLAGLPAAARGDVAADESDARTVWRVVVSGRAAPSFAAVSAVSSTNVWAVGATGEGAARSRPVAAHWDGRRLRRYRPYPAGRLVDVAAGTTEAWAVGWATAGSGTEPVVVHWNGRGWRREALPPLGDASLYAVAVASDGGVWVVGRHTVEMSVSDPADRGEAGRPLLLALDGRWHVVDVASRFQQCPTQVGDGDGGVEWTWICGSGLSDVDVAGGRVWLTGTEESGDYAGYDSATMRNPDSSDRIGQPVRLATPRAKRGGGLRSVDVEAGRLGQAWTLDAYADAASPSFYRILFWPVLGVRPRASEYEAPGASLAAIGPRSRSSAWLVGSRQVTSRREGPLVMRWNGTTVARQRTALDALANGETLTSISVLPSGEAWAAGHRLLARYGPAR